MYLLRPDRTSFNVKDGKYYSEIGTGADAELFKFAFKDVLHYQGNSVPGVVEPSVLKSARESILSDWQHKNIPLSFLHPIVMLVAFWKFQQVLRKKQKTI